MKTILKSIVFVFLVSLTIFSCRKKKKENTSLELEIEQYDNKIEESTEPNEEDFESIETESKLDVNIDEISNEYFEEDASPEEEYEKEYDEE